MIDSCNFHLPASARYTQFRSGHPCGCSSYLPTGISVPASSVNSAGLLLIFRRVAIAQLLFHARHHLDAPYRCAPSSLPCYDEDYPISPASERIPTTCCLLFSCLRPQQPVHAAIGRRKTPRKGLFPRTQAITAPGRDTDSAGELKVLLEWAECLRWAQHEEQWWEAGCPEVRLNLPQR